MLDKNFFCDKNNIINKGDFHMLFLDREFFVNEEDAASFAACNKAVETGLIDNPSKFDLPLDTDYRFFVEYVGA